MNIYDWMNEQSRRREVEGMRATPFSRVVCMDGFSVSVQASEYAYCHPRDNFGPWFSVELGFPNRRMPSLSQYAENKKAHTKTIFGYVPISAVHDLIESHGGIVPVKERQSPQF